MVKVFLKRFFTGYLIWVHLIPRLIIHYWEDFIYLYQACYIAP